MSQGTCRYCGGPDVEDGAPTDSGTCGACWWTMRLEPDKFELQMESLGRSVAHVGCIDVIPALTRADGTTTQESVGFVSRNPFEPEDV